MPEAIHTLVDVVRGHAERRPDHHAVRAAGVELTYGDLDRQSAQVAGALADAGVGPGDRVAYLDRNSWEYFPILYGVVRLGAVFVPLNWRLTPEELTGVVDDSGARALLAAEELRPLLDRVSADLPAVERVLTTAPGTDAWWSGASTSTPPFPSAPGDVAIQYYSSGTTGRPKGVLLTHDNLLAHSRMGALDWRFDDSSVVLAAMPLFHAGAGGWSMAATYRGATVHVVREPAPEAIAATIAEQGITHAFLVPAMIQMMTAMPGVARFDYSGLRMLAYGASPITERVLRDGIELFGPVFLQAYGLTEATGQVVSLPPEDHDPTGPRSHLLRSAGRPNPGVTLRVVDPASGGEVPTGAVGEIQVRSALTMKGYWRQPEETARVLGEDGWLRTGDAGYLDVEGYVYIHDRVKDMIVSGGENVFPAEVEDVLMAHPAVADVAVIGVPSDRWGEAVHALVVAAPGAEVGADEIVAHCRAQLAGYKCPQAVEWRDELPRNAAGKVLKKVLRAPYWAGHDRPVS